MPGNYPEDRIELAPVDVLQKPFTYDDLFAPVSQGRKRGDEFRF